jgi:sugar phosphate isomerase/epimerase
MAASRFPFRLGATSFVYEADLVGNARRLAGQAQDMELVLFDTPTASNLPDAATIAALAALAAPRRADLSYTVHLPADVGPADSTALAWQVVRATRPLTPQGYVVHLSPPPQPWEAPSGPFAPSSPPAHLQDWLDAARGALERLAHAAGGYEALCLENLDGWPPELLLPLLDELPISLCIDVGHLWRQGRDPLPYLEDHLPRTRIIHLHGCSADGTDHRSLAVRPEEGVRQVLRALKDYRGVLTLEVFGRSDFKTSVAALGKLWG